MNHTTRRVFARFLEANAIPHDLENVILEWVADGKDDVQELYSQLDEDGWNLPPWRNWAEALENAGFTVAHGRVTVGNPATPKYHGYHDDKALPIKAGDIVTIRAGTKIKVIGQPVKRALKTYKVKVHHVLPGMNPWRHDQTVMNPQVVWAGPGGYWASVDINDIPEAR